MWYGPRYTWYWDQMQLSDASENSHSGAPEHAAVNPGSRAPDTPEHAAVNSRARGSEQSVQTMLHTQDTEPPASFAPPSASSVTSNPPGGAAEHTRPEQVTATLARPPLQCPHCGRVLCQTHDLCFFRRINVEGGLEVHLMLKPEAAVPPTLVQASETEQGATQTWQCVCGAKLADTRRVGPNKASMTAFKSSAVMLHGQRFTSKKSMWPRVYDLELFNDIEVRTRATFRGT